MNRNKKVDMSAVKLNISTHRIVEINSIHIIPILKKK